MQKKDLTNYIISNDKHQLSNLTSTVSLYIKGREDQPSTSLVQPFSNELPRKVVLKMFSILKRIMNISIRHRSAFKPAIKYLQIENHKSNYKWLEILKNAYNQLITH